MSKPTFDYFYFVILTHRPSQYYSTMSTITNDRYYNIVYAYPMDYTVGDETSIINLYPTGTYYNIILFQGACLTIELKINVFFYIFVSLIIINNGSGTVGRVPTAI